MDEKHFQIRFSIVSFLYLTLLYFLVLGVFFSLKLSLAIFFALSALATALVVFDCIRFGIFNPPLLILRYYHSSWSLLLDEALLNKQWHNGDAYLYYDSPLVMIIRWQSYDDETSRYVLIWRDMLNDEDRHLLRIYLAL